MLPDEMIEVIKKGVEEVAKWGEREPLEAHKLEDNLMRQVILYLYHYNPDVLTKEVLRPMVKSFYIFYDRWSYAK